MQGCAASYSNATWCKQTFDGSCMPEMIQGVTLRENLPETIPASQSTLEQPDYAEDGCESGDLTSDEEDSLQEQTCRKRFKELKIM